MAEIPAITARIEGTLLGTAVSCEGLLLTMLSPKAFPPGRPIELSLLLPEGELALAGRSIGSKKRDDGLFEVRLRLVNLRKDARQKLDACFSGEPPSLER